MKKLLLTFVGILIPWMGSLSAQTYCAAGPSSTFDSEITGVVLNGTGASISQLSTACGTAGVQDFTASHVADLQINTSYSLDVTMGTCGGNYPGALAAWIDWNDDGDFDDAGEEIGIVTGSPATVQTQTWTFTVPANASLGLTRLRVMQRESGSLTSTTPCATFTWGAVEDYGINVISPTYCAAGPSSTFDSEITGVVLVGAVNSISQLSTACGTAGVQDFTATHVADLVPNYSYDLEVTMGTCGGSYPGALAAWIDWNIDGDFDDAGEEIGVITGSPTTVQTWNFTVPAGAVIGSTTRMRVMQREGGTLTSTTPCATFTWGAVEDYSISIVAPPSCATPSLLTATPAATSVDLTWDGGANYYIIEYGVSGFTPGTGDTVWSYTLSEQITGLQPATDYDFKITAYCTIGASPTSGNISATTSCVANQVSWSEGFESWGASGTAVVPACWSGIKTSTSGFGWTIDQGGTGSSGTGPSTGNMGDWYLYLETSGGALGSQSFAELPPLDLSSVSSPILRFYYHMFGATMGTLSVEVSTNSGLNWSVVETITGQQSSSNFDSYTLKDVSLANYISPNTLIRFVGERGSSFTGDMAIDDIYVGDCPPATNVAISSVGNSTTISWTSSSSDNKLEYGPTGFTQGTGTQVSPATSPAILTGLQGSTTYDVYIQDSCSATSVTWAGPYTFTTPQSLVSLPYAEGFESSSGDWLVNGSGPASWEHGAPIGTVISSASQGSKAWVTNLDGVYNNNEFSNVTTPYFDNSNGTFDVVYEFDMALATENNFDETWVEYSFNDTLWTKLLASNGSLAWYNDALNQWWEGDTDPSWTLRRAIIPNSAGEIVHVRHVFSSDASVQREGIGIDEVAAYEIPCEFPVMNLTVDTVTSSSFSLSWTSNATAWEIETGPIGFGQATGVGTITAYTNDSVTISINACDSIDIYVRATCGATNGDWVGPLTVGALCEYDIKLNQLYVDVNTCGDSATAVYAVVENKGMFDAVGFPVNTDVTGGLSATLSATYSDTLSVGESDSIMVGTFNSYAGAVGVNIVGYSQLANDQYGANDSIALNNVGYIGPNPLVQANDTICSTDAYGVLYAEPIAGLRYGWYASTTDTVPTHIGDSLIVTNPGQKTWYLGYEDPLAYTETFFAANNGGSYGNAFSVLPTSTLVINAFDINTGAAAGTNINVYVEYLLDTVDASNNAATTGWIVHDTISVVASGYQNPTNVPLSAPLVLPANQMSGLRIGSSSGLSYTNGTVVGTPLVTDSKMTIYQGWGLTGSFSPRNWNGRIYYDAGGACSDSLVPVTIEIYADTAQADFNFTIGADGYSVFFDATSSVGNVYTWDFGDGTTGSGDTITHVFADSVDVYAICLFVDDTVCMTSDMYCDGLVTTVGIEEGVLSSNIELFPNPTTGNFSVVFNTSIESNYTIEVVDSRGRKISSMSGTSSYGDNTISFDTELSNGVYVVRTILDGEIAVSRLVVRN
ncbi:GEVED domain-containing protein [Schleiferiaceae bacterium]|nr:GEVED domain-containing protein [Schleiferiaceae bacterium]MDC0376495.1 GEVED domain-containing protein [Schleiferiaceae bacterium]